MTPDIDLFKNVLTQLPVAALLFIVVWWMIKQQAATFSRMMDAQTTQMAAEREAQKDQVCAERQLYGKMIEQQQRQEERSYEILKGLLETTQYHGSILARMEQKIDTNQNCPVVRGDKKG